MITSAKHSKWHNDIIITDLKKAGLKKQCFIRFKLFTLQNTFIKKKVDVLILKDKKAVRQSLSQTVPY